MSSFGEINSFCYRATLHQQFDPPEGQHVVGIDLESLAILQLGLNQPASQTPAIAAATSSCTAKTSVNSRS
jgi:hypothetical protein